MATLYGAQAIAAQLAIHACENALVFSVNMRVNSAASCALGAEPAASMREVRWAITCGAAQASSMCWRATDEEECCFAIPSSWQPAVRAPRQARELGAASYAPGTDGSPRRRTIQDTRAEQHGQPRPGLAFTREG